jgi:hypothetical protein
MSKEFKYILDSLWICSGELAPDYNSYIEKYRNAPNCEILISRIMKALQTSSEELIQLGWQTVRKPFMWIKQLREPSTDIDLYARNIEVIKTLNRYAYDNKFPILYNPKHKYFYMECEWIPVSIAFWSIKWIIPEELNTHWVNWVKMLKPAELVAMKLRRKWRDWNFRYRAKDLNDYWNLLLSSNSWKVEFDVNRNISFSKEIWSPSVRDITMKRLCTALWMTWRGYQSKNEYSLIKELHLNNIN